MTEARRRRTPPHQKSQTWGTRSGGRLLLLLLLLQLLTMKILTPTLMQTTVNPSRGGVWMGQAVSGVLGGVPRRREKWVGMSGYVSTAVRTSPRE